MAAMTIGWMRFTVPLPLISHAIIGKSGTKAAVRRRNCWKGSHGAFDTKVMRIDFVPLLAIQREIYSVPRGMERFRNYLRTLVDDTGDDVEFPPLIAINPMARDHVPAMIDALIALDADALAAQALADAAADLGENAGKSANALTFRSSLIVVDDFNRGGWTNRFTVEHDMRMGCNPQGKRFWITGVLWSSETPPTARAVRESVLTAAYRTAFVLAHGRPQNLRDLLAQEAWTLTRAGCAAPAAGLYNQVSPDESEIEYTREVLNDYLDRNEMGVLIAAMFGDNAARELGYDPMGLSDWAGLWSALHYASLAPATDKASGQGSARHL